MNVEGHAALRERSPAGRPSSKGSHVYVNLKEAILSGQLAPGTPIDKASLCERLGVSRFPVATALHRLAFDRLVVIAPQHGTFVAPIAVSDVLECMLIRAAIEGDTTALAARETPPNLVETLDRGLRYQSAAAAADDLAGFYALDVDFHDAILASLGLSHASSILNGLRTRLERVRRILTAPPGRAFDTIEAHVGIRDAIASGDPLAARSAMRAHLDETTALFRVFAERNPTLFSDRF